MNDEEMVPITEDDFVYGPLYRRNPADLRWYAWRWAVGWADLLCGLARVVSLGFWWPSWDLAVEDRFLGHSERLFTRQPREAE